jgi:hypothetical protein
VFWGWTEVVVERGSAGFLFPAALPRPDLFATNASFLAHRKDVSYCATSRFSDREALMQTEAVLAEIQNRLWTSTPTLPQN